MSCRARIAGIFLLIFITPVSAQPLPDKQATLFLDFARDVSGGNPFIMVRTRELIAAPPTTVETIGFYGLEDTPAPERVLRGIISVLDEEGFLIGVEDKYVYELPYLLAQKGWAKGESPDLDVLTGLAFAFEAERDPTAEDWQAFRMFFPKHTDAVEASVTRANRQLLSVRLPLGDTMYVWAPVQDVAKKWKGKPLYFAFESTQNRQGVFPLISITPPAWDIYWEFMIYALNIPESHGSVPTQE